MTLSRIESFTTPDVGFVRVTMEDGAQGWGQVPTYHSDITAQVLHRQVAPRVLGRDTTDLDDLLDLVTEREHKFPGSYLRRAMGGLDTAIWDMRGIGWANRWPNCWAAVPAVCAPMPAR